jgi:hypothetical protein
MKISVRGDQHDAACVQDFANMRLHVWPLPASSRVEDREKPRFATAMRISSRLSAVRRTM